MSLVSQLTYPLLFVSGAAAVLLPVLGVPQHCLRQHCRNRATSGIFLGILEVLAWSAAFSTIMAAIVAINMHSNATSLPDCLEVAAIIILSGLLSGAAIGLAWMPLAIRDIRYQKRNARSMAALLLQSFAINSSHDGVIAGAALRNLRCTDPRAARYLNRYLRDVGHMVRDEIRNVPGSRFPARVIEYAVSRDDLATYPDRIERIYAHW